MICQNPTMFEHPAETNTVRTESDNGHGWSLDLLILPKKVDSIVGGAAATEN